MKQAGSMKSDQRPSRVMLAFRNSSRVDSQPRMKKIITLFILATAKPSWRGIFQVRLVCACTLLSMVPPAGSTRQQASDTEGWGGAAQNGVAVPPKLRMRPACEGCPMKIYNSAVGGRTLCTESTGGSRISAAKPGAYPTP